MRDADRRAINDLSIWMSSCFNPYLFFPPPSSRSERQKPALVLQQELEVMLTLSSQFNNILRSLSDSLFTKLGCFREALLLNYPSKQSRSHQPDSQTSWSQKKNILQKPIFHLTMAVRDRWGTERRRDWRDGKSRQVDEWIKHYAWQKLKEKIPSEILKTSGGAGGTHHTSHSAESTVRKQGEHFQLAAYIKELFRCSAGIINTTLILKSWDVP